MYVNVSCNIHVFNSEKQERSTSAYISDQWRTYGFPRPGTMSVWAPPPSLFVAA